MTTRRDAELHVLEMAARFTKWASRNPSTMPSEVTDLMDAVVALEQIPLELPSTAPVKNRAPLTAQQAAAWMRGDRAVGMAGRIVRHMRRNYPAGYTVDYLEEVLGGRHQTVSARVHELRKAGWIRTSGVTAKTRSGRDAEVYYLTADALHVLDKAAS